MLTSLNWLGGSVIWTHKGQKDSLIPPYWMSSVSTHRSSAEVCTCWTGSKTLLVRTSLFYTVLLLAITSCIPTSMASARAPKQWCLTKVETVNSFENWRQNLQYTLSLDANFAQFLTDGVEWQKKSRANPMRGFVDDDESIPVLSRRTAQQKVTQLELMLGQIANYCPVIARSTIVKNSTSIGGIWQTIRMHFGFQSTGAHFIDFNDIRLETEERPEDLYQRLVAFAEDNLLKRNGGISHHGEVIEEDEELTPSMENFIVLTWLRLVHHDLPRLVKQRYGTELRSRSLASIKPEISQAMESLLDEVHTSEEVKVLRSVSKGAGSYSHFNSSATSRARGPSQSRPVKSCPLCKQAGRPRYDHYLSTCSYLPECDKKYLSKARVISSSYTTDDVDEDDGDEHHDVIVTPDAGQASTRRVQVHKSPYFNAFYKHHPIRITVDSGAETNMIRESFVKQIGVPVVKSSQTALQADGVSPLEVVGEIRILLSREGQEFLLEALVVADMDVEVLAGVPFMFTNDISVRPAKYEVILKDGTVYRYGSSTKVGPHVVRRAQIHVLRAPSKRTTVWPGEFVELEIPADVEDSILALEPRTDVAESRSCAEYWPKPDIIASVGRKVRIVNDSDKPRVLKRHEHFCQVVPVMSPVDGGTDLPVSSTAVKPSSTYHSDTIKLDPDNILSESMRKQFESLHRELDDVFDPSYKGYNGAVGPFQAVVNMGPVLPPQRKGRVPQYARDKLVELQNKFDELEGAGVFKRPEDIGVNVEYLNPSFLVKKSNGSFRLVTAFSDVGRYSKPQPSLLPDVDSIIRTIAQWKYIIVSDLTSAFYQIPLAKESMKYCGVATPFRGIRVYTRSAMGMPGSETALEELMCRVLGGLVQEGIVTKIADDLYCGGNTPQELHQNWRRVLLALHKCKLCLSASKTVVAPKSTTILGWIWSEGSIQANPHRVSALASCTLPDTVKGLRSFIGAFKVLSRVLPDCARLVSPLDSVVAGKESSTKISWSDDERSAFQTCQSALANTKSIVIPTPSDQLWIVTDGAVKVAGLGATLYVSRGGQPKLAGFFSAKLRKLQSDWIPCEVEALSIAAAVKHFAPYIVQSYNKACVLTDSKPCVQAFEKLCRGEYSSSMRVATFLSTVSRFQVSVRHLAGKANLPSDFASRNASECSEPRCQVCLFVIQAEESVVRNVSVSELLSGDVKLPFTSRAAWKVTQSECPDLRRARAHLRQGTRPSKKATDIKDVKRYINVATVARDALMVVRRDDPLVTTRELIVVPRQVLLGLLTALHVKLDHPSCHQLGLVVRRFFYALDMDRAIAQVTKSCHQCASLQNIPHTLISQSTSDPPDAVGVTFAADVIKRERQLVFVLRESITSFTAACLIDNEQSCTLREAMVQLCLGLRPEHGPMALVRTDAAPGFQGLVNDDQLRQLRICIEIGRVKSPNKNPVAERAIQELEAELLRQKPCGGPVSKVTLSIAVARLNTRIRSHGLSAREMWFQRDQFTNEQLPLSDREVIIDKHNKRLANHPHSEISKAPRGKASRLECVCVGDLVYLYADGNKCRARDRYLVVSVDGDWCHIRKFSGSQLRCTSYRVKRTECYKVFADSSTYLSSNHHFEDSDSDCEERTNMCVPAPSLPGVPPELSTDFINETAGVVEHNDLTPTDVIPGGSDSESSVISQPQVEGAATSYDIAPRRSTRQRKLPKRFDDYEVNW